MSNVTQNTRVTIPTKELFNNILQFLSNLFEGFNRERLTYYHMKCLQQQAQPDCLLFSLYKIEHLSTLSGRRTGGKSFTVADVGKRNVFLISLLGMRVMSEREEMKDSDIDQIGKDMNRDIKSDETSDSDVFVEKVVKKPEKYKGKDVDLKTLSESLQHFEVEDWEDGINWYEKTAEKFFGKLILNSKGKHKENKYKFLIRKFRLKVRYCDYFHSMNDNYKY